MVKLLFIVAFFLIKPIKVFNTKQLDRNITYTNDITEDVVRILEIQLESTIELSKSII